MASRVTANELLLAVATTGYFKHPELHQELFRQTVENKLGVGLTRAIELLKEAGLATFSYPAETEVAARDILDRWQVRLTPAGEAELAGKV